MEDWKDMNQIQRWETFINVQASRAEILDWHTWNASNEDRVEPVSLPSDAALTVFWAQLGTEIYLYASILSLGSL